MLKKLKHLSILFIYLFSISGIPFYSHFCDYNLVGIDLFVADANLNDCCGEQEESADCCFDLVIKAQVKDPSIAPKTPRIPSLVNFVCQNIFQYGIPFMAMSTGFTTNYFWKPEYLPDELHGQNRLMVFRI